jgi:hypothetical protein
MIYAEYIERDRFLPLEIFRLLGDQSAWTDPNDRLVGSFGRTMRLGPMPSYLAFWQCSGMGRMDEWEAHFRSPEAQFDVGEKATHRAIHLQYGGCYDELVSTPAVERDGLYCIEYFAAHSRTPSAEVERHFRARGSAGSAGRLDFLLRRIGRLGPEPGCIAVWTFADYRTLEAFERDRDDDDPFRPAQVGVYRWFGRETL